LKKSFKTELDPSKLHVAFFKMCCDARRFTYNWLLVRYNNSYDDVSSKVEGALVRLHKDPNDSDAIDILLRLTLIGLEESPERIDRRKNNVRGPRSQEFHDANKKWHEKQLADKTVRAARIELFRDLANRWVKYCEALRAYKDLPKEERKQRPKRPEIKLCLFQLFKGDSWDNFLKMKWRKAARDERDREVREDVPEVDRCFGWYKIVPSSVIDLTVIDLKAAFTRWFGYLKLPPDKKLLVPEVGHPKPKSPHSNESFSLISTGIRVETNRIKLVNIGWIKLKEKDYLPVGRNKSRMTVSAQGGHWFISLLNDFEPEKLPEHRPDVGIDVGIVDYAILQPNNGPIERISNPNYRETGKKRLAMLNRRIDRKSGPEVFVVIKPDGTEVVCPSRRHPVAREAIANGWTIKSKRAKPSNRWKKAQERLNRHYYRMSCKHRHFQHENTTAIIKRFGRISIETLGIIDMMLRRPKCGRTKSSDRKLRRMMGGAAWYEFRRQLQYKGEWYGSYVEAVSRWYPSTQDCSKCHAKTEVNWHDRKCRCERCGLVIDMDDNAAINLLFEMSRNSSQVAAD